MGDHEFGSPKRQHSVHIIIEVQQIWPTLLFEFKQPLPSRVNLLPGLVHPLQFVNTFPEPDIWTTLERCSLGERKRLPHCRKYDFDSILGQSSGQSQCVIPDSTECICGHQNSHRKSPIGWQLRVMTRSKRYAARRKPLQPAALAL